MLEKGVYYIFWHAEHDGRHSFVDSGIGFWVVAPYLIIEIASTAVG